MTYIIDENNILDIEELRYKVEKRKHKNKKAINMLTDWNPTVNEEKPILKTKLTGFQNIGNSCFMNSFLQILFHTPYFLETLKESNKDKNDILIDSLIQLSENHKKVYLLKKIKKLMADIDKSYETKVQNDSQEFGIFLINKIISNIKGNLKFNDDDYYNSEEININNCKEHKLQKFNEYKKIYCIKETLLDKMFQFHEILFNIDSHEQIFCNYKKIDFNSFLNIELSFPFNNKKNIYNLSELLEYKYPKNPLLEINTESISKLKELWKKFLEKIKQLFNRFCGEENEENIRYNDDINDLYYSNLVTLPNILIISINRALLGKSINKNILIFEETLDLKNYLDNDFLANQDTKYKLFGVNICYKSFFESGHYYSFVKIDDKWHKFDDDKPVVIQEPEFESKYVVGLYYVKEKYNYKEEILTSIY